MFKDISTSVEKFDHTPENKYVEFINSELGEYMISHGIALAPRYIVYKNLIFMFNPYLHLEENLKIIMSESMYGDDIYKYVVYELEGILEAYNRKDKLKKILM